MLSWKLLGICGLMPSAMLKPEVYVGVSGATAARIGADVPVQVTTKGHTDAIGLGCHLRLC